MKIVVFEVETREASSFEALKASHDVLLVEDDLDGGTAEQFADAQILSTFIYSRLDRKILERLPALRLIATRSTGFDHIDTAIDRA